MHYTRRLTLLLLPLLLSLFSSVHAEDSSLKIELELGQVWQERNKVQIPNNASGDRFLLTDIAGTGAWTSARVNASWNLRGRHGMRLVLAPLSYKETGELPADTRFAGETFSMNQPIGGEYRFDSWRLGYTYQYHSSENWRLWVGATAKIRDAGIELAQGNTSSTDDNTGFVPLLYLAGEYQISPRWSFGFDFDGLAGGPGRAFDLSLKLRYRLNDDWRVSAGYRTLEGGVDNTDVYNFAWFNTALLSMEYQF